MRYDKAFGLALFLSIIFIGTTLYVGRKVDIEKNELKAEHKEISELINQPRYEMKIDEKPLCCEPNVITVHDIITKTVVDTVFVKSNPETVTVTETLPAPDPKYIHVTGCCYPPLRTLTEGEIVCDGSFKMCNQRTTQKSHYASNFPMVWRNLKEMWGE